MPDFDIKFSHLPWVEKYRPSTLDDLVSRKEMTETISRFITENRLPHLLFYGPPGTGKTSTILAAAKQMYTPKQFSSMVLELNASDDRGIGIVRDQIMNFAQTKTLHIDKNERNCVKLVILDEADAMTKDAQSALRRVIEKFTDNVRFCIICNYLSKVIPAIQSRCTRFRFAPLSESDMLPRLRSIAKAENVNLTTDGEQALLRLSEGDMRLVLNIMQSAAMAFPEVNEQNVYLCVGQPMPSDVMNVIKYLLNDSFEDAFNKIENMRIERGFALSDILLAMHDTIFQLDVPEEVTASLIAKMSEIEFRLSRGCTDRIQLASLISAFTEVRAFVDKAIPNNDNDDGSGGNPNQQMYYQQQGVSISTSNYPPMADQRQQMVGMQMGQATNVLSQPGIPISQATGSMQPQQSGGLGASGQMYMAGPMTSTQQQQQQQEQQQQGRGYSAGPSTSEQLLGMRSSNMQQIYGGNVSQYMQSDSSQPHYPQMQSQPQNQSMMSHTTPMMRYANIMHTEPKKEERVFRPLNPPPYSPDVLDNLSRYTVYTLSVIGRELVNELLWRTCNLMTILSKFFERRPQQQQTLVDPEPLLEYCYLLLGKIAEIALRIDQAGPSNRISEDEFLALMSQPDEPKVTPEEASKGELFEEQRQRLVKLSTALKKFEWMAMVSDPRFLKS
uniref:AAA domain-containing protein n=1 Tax=Syphacia muris TaxID=451379 RepID=A0A0N5AZ16_9BILA